MRQNWSVLSNFAFPFSLNADPWLSMQILTTAVQFCISVFTKYRSLWFIECVFHACRKSSTYQLLTFISELSSLNFSDLVVQKFTLDRETLKMKVVLALKLCNLLLSTTRIIYANTYDSSSNWFYLIGVSKSGIGIQCKSKSKIAPLS